MGEFIGIEGIDHITCHVVKDGKECGNRFRRITYDHLKYKHNMTRQEYMKEYPDALLSCLRSSIRVSQGKRKIGIFGMFLEAVESLLLLPLCNCDCGGRVVRRGNRYILGHGGRGRTKFNDPSVARRADKMRNRTKHTHPGPAASSKALTGRTKLNDPGVAARADMIRGRTKETHQYLVTRSKRMTGRTKEDYPYLADSGIKISIALTGRTKYNDPGYASVSATLSGRTKETHFSVARQAEKMSAKWQDPEWVDSLSGQFWGIESAHHSDLKLLICETLQSSGWTVILEKWITINGKHYKVDVWAQKAERKVIFEIGGCPEPKLDNLRLLYGDDNVFHIPYGVREEHILEQVFIQIERQDSVYGEDER